MFNHFDLLILLLSPVMAYLAAAVIFSLVESRKAGAAAPVQTASFEYHDGQRSVQ
ncbi:hypothetical protein [Aliiglaciecola litoralis]|uniref:Uncharacterized protein n=1 Tax=Aliiglaciecola litoralis TaxID=582857 RepID=A0ABP3WP03_9ALTE